MIEFAKSHPNWSAVILGLIILAITTAFEYVYQKLNKKG